jgi:ankyrin repeat protein
MNLASLANSGDRNGCLAVIPTLQLNEINTIIDPVNQLTFLHRACQLKEVSIATSLLQHGADISIKNSLGQTCWSIAISEASFSMLMALAPYVHPSVSNSLTDLIGSKLSETDILSLLNVLLSNQQSEWVDLHHEAVHWSVFLERFEILKFLLHSGFEVSLRKLNGRGLSPLQVAEVRLIWICTPEEKRQSLR